jgi:carboxymethylenebutenolidase
MIVTTAFVDVPADQTPMRLLVAEPAAEIGHFPGIVLYADIFALTEPTIRAAVRIASYGFVVAAPEFYHRTEAAGTVIPFADRDHAFRASESTRAADFDADTRTTLDYLAAHPRVRSGALGATGFCIGGHLAVRAALQPDVKAAVAFYPTGLHADTLGGSTGADTLARAAAGGIAGKLSLVFGAKDPHIPLEAISLVPHSPAAAATTRSRCMTASMPSCAMRDRAGIPARPIAPTRTRSISFAPRWARGVDDGTSPCLTTTGAWCTPPTARCRCQSPRNAARPLCDPRTRRPTTALCGSCAKSGGPAP